MKAVVYRRARARQDLVDSYLFFAREAGSRVADRFLTEAESTFTRLNEQSVRSLEAIS